MYRPNLQQTAVTKAAIMKAMGQALYRKYRSKSLDEIVGQSHVVEILKRSIDTDKLAHAYLLTGIRGVGKTSIARILAHEINHLPYEEGDSHLDIIEIDAASNSSVEDIRGLREKSMIAPVQAPKKIYIIDEVHMLSKSAFNALLKTLEEPPAHVVFILATTDVHKLPATILSRVQRFNLRPISLDDLQSHLRTIADKEQITIDDDALRLVAIHGNGSFRDAITLLDQVRSIAEDTITATQIEASLGLIESAKISHLFDLYAAHNTTEIIALVRHAEQTGVPALALIDQLLVEGRERSYTDPSLLPLLDQLVEARKSQWPDIKLLAALIQNVAPQGTIKHEMKPALPEQKVTSSPTKPKKTASLAVSPKEPIIETESTESNSGKPKATDTSRKSVEFDWHTFCEAVREKSIGAYSVLSRCTSVSDGEKLTIYCGKQFAKKQLEKSLPILSGALERMGIENGTIELIPSVKPSENQDLAAALAIMGGGEEVKL